MKLTASGNVQDFHLIPFSFRMVRKTFDAANVYEIEKMSNKFLGHAADT